MRGPDFILADDALVPLSAVRHVDLSEIEALRLVIVHDGGRAIATDIRAIEALMLLKPSAYEGRRLRAARHAWAVHNLVGHPLMQLFALLGFRRLAIRVHDGTVPRPLVRDDSS